MLVMMLHKLLHINNGNKILFFSYDLSFLSLFYRYTQMQTAASLAASLSQSQTPSTNYSGMPVSNKKQNFNFRIDWCFFYLMIMTIVEFFLLMFELPI